MVSKLLLFYKPHPRIGQQNAPLPLGHKAPCGEGLAATWRQTSFLGKVDGGRRPVHSSPLMAQPGIWRRRGAGLSSEGTTATCILSSVLWLLCGERCNSSCRQKSVIKIKFFSRLRSECLIFFRKRKPVCGEEQ